MDTSVNDAGNKSQFVSTAAQTDQRSAREILADLGVRLHAYHVGTYRVRCSACNKLDDIGNLSVTIKKNWVLWHCFRAGCDLSGGKKLNDEPDDFPEGAPIKDPPKYPRLSPAWSMVWDYSSSVTADDPAGRYLAGRRCDIEPVIHPDAPFAYRPDCPYGDRKNTELCDYIDLMGGEEYPALLALITDIYTDEPISIHRTFLKRDGSGKADVKPCRKYLKGHRKNGVVRIHADEDVTCGLTIGEGIETCLSFALAFRPVWSCLDADNLAKFPVLLGIESLTVLVDNDDAGHHAFEQVCRRYNAAGIEVRRIESPVPDEDINDLARAAS